MKSYWDTNFKMNTFGKDIVEVCPCPALGLQLADIHITESCCTACIQI